MAKTKIKPNRFKPDPKAPKTAQALADSVRTKRLFRVLSAVFMVAMMSLGAIYAHDAVVQSPFFTVSRIQITGLHRLTRADILETAGLDREVNLFELHLPAVEKKLSRHPWVAEARAQRRLFSTLEIIVTEEEPLAIVTIENLADVIINTQGKPFKEYDPSKDKLQGLPVISGVDLSLSQDRYLFEGDLFNAIMDLLKIQNLGQVRTIHGDENTGITIKALDIYNKTLYKEGTQETQARALIPIKLGFSRFSQKLARAKKISRYMEAQFPSKTILAMDLYDIEKVFIKTGDALHNDSEKGV